jgi:uncharacterized protein
MPLSLYAATIPSFLQIIDAVDGLVGKAEAFCAERGLAPADLLQACLAEDMFPFAYQVKSVAVHSLGAIEGVRCGAFSPDRSAPPESFDGLRAKLGEARDGLATITAEEMESLIGRDMRFSIGSYSLDFTADDFLLSFSKPNFYFHATTAYDILRWKGVPIGKRDFLGAVLTR